ncbi:NYN domain-containing protein [Metaclostridioides mangenotii]|uniref:NYN domain-containing protein n=1 Tax=Metaclostridioides mangenotii TaxID=1540 RepID=UPI0004B2B768|nr:NYN domain-containing protein [Clostridioides mangenotii]
MANRTLRKKTQYLIIDGYNIINAWEDLRALAREDLEDSREKLIDEVIEYAEFSGYKAIIVFDAYNVKNSREKVEKREHITVVYTKEHQTADSYIEKFITTLSEYDDVKVVTNDYAEQQIILGKGAARVSARELRLDIDNSKVKIREKNVVFGKKIDRNRLDERLDKEILSKLENIRKKR